MYISLIYSPYLPLNVYEIHVYHNFGKYNFALEIVVNSSLDYLYPELNTWGLNRYDIGLNVGPNSPYGYKQINKQKFKKIMKDFQIYKKKI